MKRITSFISGFIACLMIVYSAFVYVIWKAARGEEINGFKVEPVRSRPVRYIQSWNSTYKIHPEYSVTMELISTLNSFRFRSHYQARSMQQWLFDSLNQYGRVSVGEYFDELRGKGIAVVKHDNDSYNIGWLESDMSTEDVVEIKEDGYKYKLCLPMPKYFID